MTDISEQPASVVLLGYGLGGRVFHGPLISTTPGLSLDAVVTGDPDRQAQARSAFPDADIYATADEAWAGGHDLAVISTANITHIEHATAALKGGLHVVLDKPIAPTAPVARDLGTLAIEHGRLLVPFQNRRWDSDFRTAVAVAESGEIGTVHRFESRIERMRVVPKGGWRDSTDPRDMGGMLYDLGAHVVDQALLLMGPVEAVTASVRSLRVPGATDDDVTILLEHTSGAVSMLVVSQVGAFPGPRFTLYGTRGGLRIEASDSQEAQLVAGRLPAVGIEWGVEPAGSAALLRRYDDASSATDVERELEPGMWPTFYAQVQKAMSSGSPPPVLLADVVADLEVLDAARESARSGQRVRMDPPAGHHA